ncbi:hypothetical protein B7R54_14580 [Subtercola boreus]|uniref:HTH tetR-type domain-containing protein n=1 Tax=Subtercola boreus TaxID=120213 RepID=A0A3E0VKX3_9MICO|nr:TetR/AcrR family transcriptional regulator [Subtercola boreus]RFA10299.1 hypothetical protein B7R54_14580 [Subtercola boreus]TQL56199.1 TetR family transcriptional regulator [Subtercola boreus]
MGRVSKAEQERHREEILDAAARQVKELGLDGVTIPGVMSAVGLTRGGFYGHFSSKADLEARAVERAFDVQSRTFATVARHHPGDHDAALGEIVDFYLSDVHRRQLDRSCPIAALSADVAREPDDSPARTAYAAGLTENLSHLTGLAEPEGVVPSPSQRADTLVTMATAVGAIIIARAADGHPIADEILAAVKVALR